MADFLESAKSMVNAAVSRTSWEAQKQMRVRSKQTEIDKLLAQRQQLLDELGQIAMNLYQQGKLTDQQLSRLCASIQELDACIDSRLYSACLIVDIFNFSGFKSRSEISALPSMWHYYTPKCSLLSKLWHKIALIGV